VIGNDNIDNIGLSSGKLFKHLSLEQPVIAMDCPGLGRVVRKYKLGKTIHNVSEIKEAYEDIMKNYSLYQGNIRKVYQKKFDYDKVIQPFLKYLEA
jgi:glycosyltransferase involved in cell wall biosynthesis